MKTKILLPSYLAKFFVEWDTFQTKAVENIETYLMFTDLFFPENRAVYEIMWKKYCRVGQMTMWRMRIACWIPKATHTHLEYVILFYHCNSDWARLFSVHTSPVFARIIGSVNPLTQALLCFPTKTHRIAVRRLPWREYKRVMTHDC